MTKSRRAKFRRWLADGIPKRAPLSERRAFGAFKTNELRQFRKAFGIKSVTKAKRVDTTVSRGWMQEFEIFESFDRFSDTEWLADLAKLVDDFRKRKRGKVAFFRLKLKVAGKLSYITVDSGAEDELVDKWVGSKKFTDLESALTSVQELADRLNEDLADRGPDMESGYIELVHVYTLNPK